VQQRHRSWLFIFFAAIFLLPALACGSLAPPERPTPSPMESAPATVTGTSTPTATATSVAQPTIVLLIPTATATPYLPVGGRGLIVARKDLNVRSKATTHAALVGQLPPRAVVTIKNGPRKADGYIWWLVDDGHGLLGWIAEGDAKDKWLVAMPSATPTVAPDQLAIGRKIVVTTHGASWLAMHAKPSRFAKTVHRYPPGSILIVKDGPVAREGYHWWLLLSKDGTEGWMAEGDNEDRWLKPLLP